MIKRIMNPWNENDWCVNDDKICCFNCVIENKTERKIFIHLLLQWLWRWWLYFYLVSIYKTLYSKYNTRKMFIYEIRALKPHSWEYTCTSTRTSMIFLGYKKITNSSLLSFVLIDDWRGTTTKKWEIIFKIN